MPLVKNPLEGQGSRNLFCGHYDACLHHAGVMGWQCFHCEECSPLTVGDLDFIKPVEIPDFNDSGLFLDDEQESELISFDPKELFFSKYKSGDSENEPD